MKKNGMSNIGTSGFDALKSVAARCSRRALARSLAQVASLLVLAGTFAAASSRPAMAQGGTEFTIKLAKFHRSQVKDSRRLSRP